MAKRKSNDALGGVFELAAMLPWWVGVGLAVLAYVLLHRVAIAEVAPATQLGQLGAMAGHQLLKVLASFGQYILPILLLGGASASAIGRQRSGSSDRRASESFDATVRIAPGVTTRAGSKGNLIRAGGEDKAGPHRFGFNQALKRAVPDQSRGNNAGEQLRKKPSLKPETWSSELLSSIEWKRFEDLSAAYYREKGIRCETTNLGADGGVDLKLYQDDSGKPTAIVQCEAWTGRMVGVKPVRELRGVMASEQIEKGFFMTSGTFSDDAKAFAQTNRVTLLDGGLFLAMIKRLPPDAQTRLLNFATEGDYTTPTCPSCGIKMMKRDGGRGPFWGCGNYPRCKQKLHIRRDAVQA